MVLYTKTLLWVITHLESKRCSNITHFLGSLNAKITKIFKKVNNMIFQIQAVFLGFFLKWLGVQSFDDFFSLYLLLYGW